MDTTAVQGALQQAAWDSNAYHGKYIARVSRK
jgi:hypothetical protein